MFHKSSTLEYSGRAVDAVERRIATREVVWAEADSEAQRRLAAERAVDSALADSFPASDPPSWTLGVTPAPRQETATNEADATLVER